MSNKEQITELTAEMVNQMFPIHKEPKIPTLDKPLIIESACPGWQVGGERYPAVPISIEDQIREISDSVKAGAACIHIHPRDPSTGLAKIDPHLLKEIMDGVFDEVGDCVTLNHTWQPSYNEDVDYISETKELLELGNGNKYCQGTVVLPVGYWQEQWNCGFSEKATRAGVKWMEENDIKPVYQLYDTYSHFHFNHLFNENISTNKPYLLNLHLGKHSSHAIHQDPESYFQLITNFNMVQKTIPESIIGVYPGGRNWLPIMVLGILMGAQLIRVGIEDCYWMYPHKDEIIKKNSEVVELAVQVANLLGRRVVTDAEEARDILGMKLTSDLTKQV